MLASLFFLYVARRRPFLTLKIFCGAHKSSCGMLRDFSFSFSLSYSCVPPHTSLLSIWPLELLSIFCSFQSSASAICRNLSLVSSRRLQPVFPSDALSLPEARVSSPPGTTMAPIATTYLAGDATSRSEDQYEHGGGHVFGQRILDNQNGSYATK